MIGLLRFVKEDQANLLKDEYVRLGSVLNNMTVTQLVRRVEVELSKNQTFEVMNLSALAQAH